MRYDIITVTYNSQKWLDNFFASLEALNYDKSQLRLILVDNASSDETAARCRAYAAVSTLGEVKVLETGANLGFGRGNNYGVKQGDAPLLFLLNVDTEICPDALTNMDEFVLQAQADAVAFEMYQLPVEHGKPMDPVTMETAWAVAAALVVKRSAFEAVSGFDENIFMYAEDVDLSWRLRANGGKILFCPQAKVVHHGWQKSDSSRRFEYLYCAYARLVLGYKYGNLSRILKQNRQYLDTLKNPVHFDGVRKALLKLYLKHFTQILSFLGFRFRQPKLFKANIPDFEKDFTLSRGSIPVPVTEDGPLVSVVVRTHKRKEVLRRTLQCLYHQTYRNFEVVVVEDGADTAGDMVRSEFPGLNVRYLATGENVGRGRAGNIGVEHTRGELICFLDDDDFYYPDFIAAHAAQFALHPEADLVISGSMAIKSRTESTDPYVYTYTDTFPVLFDHITLMDMCVRCRIPMPNAMFRRRMYEMCGGMHESIGGDEDWFMWLKFMAKGRRIHPDHADIDKAMTACLYPADDAAAKKREEVYAVFDKQMLYDESLVFTVSGEEIARWETYVKNDVAHLRNLGRLDAFMAELKPLGEEKLAYDPAGSNTLTAKQINHYYYWLVKQYAAQA